ncbi:MAG: rane-bound lytic murein transglycosylase [Rhodospirillaceae bacterium]|jgi:membrane-bound lytic murein transglycosylase A|nr:rane-bound lytic murein transglycosylase [Rhodospirillaceae bacterium]
MRWTVLSGRAAWMAAAGLLAACAGGVGGPTEQRVAMAPISFNEIAGWGEDKQSEALAAFRRSCPKLTAGPDTKITTDGGTKTITPAEWKRICDSAAAVRANDDRAARAFFEENFRPLMVQAPGKFTGYFEPEMRGSRVPSRIFTVPVYRRPADLTDNPYYTRAEIEQGVLKGKGLEIAWVQDPVALYEVQVQGSGRVHLAEGGVLSLGFDGSNNRPYTAIGTVLVEMGVMQKDAVTWPAIRDWLKRNPQQARDVMRKNERYIFFKDTKSQSASGSEGVPLTAQRSLAVDVTLTPYGTPIWIDTVRPVARKPGVTEPYRRLTIAQDSGAAIQGPARGDVFFGSNAQAADWAGRMVGEGRAIVLVPNKG